MKIDTNKNKTKTSSGKKKGGEPNYNQDFLKYLFFDDIKKKK